MALDTAFYLVTRDIAIRSGLVDVRYRTLDNRFILDNKDLSRVRFTTDEYVNGLDGVEKITEAEAQTLIAKGGYKKGLAIEYVGQTSNSEEEPISEEVSSVETNKVDGTEEETTTEPTEQEQEGDKEVETNEKQEEE